MANAKNRAMLNSTSISAVETEVSRARGLMLNSGSAVNTNDYVSGASVAVIDNLHGLVRGQSFGSSAQRFGMHADKKQGALPGPGKYYGFGAGNGMASRHSTDARSLDQQWNNNSQSTKFGRFAPNNVPHAT